MNMLGTAGSLLQFGTFGIAVRSLRIETSRERSTNAGENLYYGRMGREGAKSPDDPSCFVATCVLVVFACFLWGHVFKFLD